MIPHWTFLFTYGYGGLAVMALGLLAGLQASRWEWRLASPAAVWAGSSLLALPLVGMVVLSTGYLLSPTYADHIEASAASLVHYFRQGLPLYPDLTSYTFHGLLYGPLLSEASSLGYLIASGAIASKLVGWTAAWTAVTVLVLTARSGRRDAIWAAASACSLAALATVGTVMISDRSDPLLLLWASLALFAVVRLPPWSGLLLAACLAGSAADLKAHGPLYIAPALALWASAHLARRGARLGWGAGLAAAGAAAVGFLLPFIPAGASLPGYLHYLWLGGHHGLDLDVFGRNCVFLAGLWTPAVLVLITTRTLPLTPERWLAGALLAAQLIVAVVASKRGAGLHHLLPFVCFHAFLLERWLRQAASRSPDVARGAALACCVAVLGSVPMAAVGLRGALYFDLQRPYQQAVQQDVVKLAGRYPGVMMGITDVTSLGLTNYRTWLTLRGNRQTDYGALMDWTASGASDAPLVLALEDCEIPFVLIPQGPARPFSMYNPYNGEPLFSDEVRRVFAQHYSRVGRGEYFEVFGCEGTRDGTGQLATRK